MAHELDKDTATLELDKDNTTHNTLPLNEETTTHEPTGDSTTHDTLALNRDTATHELIKDTDTLVLDQATITADVWEALGISDFDPFRMLNPA